MQKLAVSLCNVSVDDLRSFTRNSYVRFLIDNGIMPARSDSQIDYDPVALTRHAAELIDWLERDGHQVMFLGDDRYPFLLAIGDDPPYRLSCIGNLPEAPTVSVAGTRTPTGIAAHEAFRFGLSAALNSTSIITALSEGCDQACAQGVVDGGGQVLTILPCGLGGHQYPNCRKLRERILCCNGGEISPYLPAEPPLRWRFHQRNSILASYSQAFVAFQGGVASGALLCVDIALRLGRDVFIHRCGTTAATVSKGTLHLVEEGAPVVDGYEDFAGKMDIPYRCSVWVKKLADNEIPAGRLRIARMSDSLYRYRDAWYSPCHEQSRGCCT